MGLDINKIRNDFPILQQQVYGKPYVYLDNGATTQKPGVVVDLLRDFYLHSNSNIHRGVHFYSEKATVAYEKARETVRDFINAEQSHEIIFTKGTTESINLVAFSFGEKYIMEGDEIIISALEHHSNIVPWQMLCERKNAQLKIIPINEKGEIIISVLPKLISEKTKLLAVNHISNSLGTINPVKKVIEIAHSYDIPVLIDGAQSIQHSDIDVKELDCDFFTFSGHKIYGPTGIGILYGKEKWLEDMPPYQGGGDMIKNVTFEKTTYGDLPLKFEAGTPHYIGAITLGRAIEYVRDIGIQNIIDHEHYLIEYADKKLSQIDKLNIYGQAAEKTGSISFLLDDVHHYDTGMVLDKMGIAVRTGSHCTEPVMKFFDITGTVRASFAVYNTSEEVDMLCEAIEKVKKMFLS